MKTNPVREAGIVWEELEGEALLVNPETKSSWRLNATATQIWRHCTGAHGLTELARAIARKTGAEVRKVEEEVAALCRRLEGAGLLRAATATSGSAPMAFTGLTSYISPSVASRSLTGRGGRR